MTQEQLGEKAQLDQTYLSSIERGTRNPSVLVLGRIAAALMGWNFVERVKPEGLPGN